MNIGTEQDPIELPEPVNPAWVTEDPAPADPVADPVPVEVPA